MSATDKELVAEEATYTDTVYLPPVLRLASKWATYQGDRKSMLRGIYGPNEFRELMTVVTVDYDEETDTSRVGFAYTTTPDLRFVLWAEQSKAIDLEVSQSAYHEIATNPRWTAGFDLLGDAA